MQKSHTGQISFLGKSAATAFLALHANEFNLSLTSLSSKGWLNPVTTYCVSGEAKNVEQFQDALEQAYMAHADALENIQMLEESIKQANARLWIEKSNPVSRLMAKKSNVLTLCAIFSFLGILIGGAAGLTYTFAAFDHVVPWIVPIIATAVFVASLWLMKQVFSVTNSPERHVKILLQSR